MKKNFLLISLSAIIIIAGASFGYQNLEPANIESSYVIPQDPADAKFPKGAKIYKEKCMVCHLVTGEGMAGVFPPLKNSDYLLADKKRAVEQVLNGSNEAMTVNGQVYTVPMPPQVDNHQDAVDVINYVLNAWGNDGGTITLEEVKDIKIVR